jgi:hypothetical protein
MESRRRLRLAIDPLSGEGVVAGCADGTGSESTNAVARRTSESFDAGKDASGANSPRNARGTSGRAGSSESAS